MPIWVNSDGKVLVDMSKVVYECDACPCCVPPPPDYTGLIYVTFAGVMICTDCINNDTPPLSNSLASGFNLNVTFAVPYDSPGLFILSSQGSFTLTFYDDPDCSGESVSEPGSFAIAVQISGASAIVTIGLVLDSDPSTVFETVFLANGLFCDELINPELCGDNSRGFGGTVMLSLDPP